MAFVRQGKHVYVLLIVLTSGMDADQTKSVYPRGCALGQSVVMMDVASKAKVVGASTATASRAFAQKDMFAA